MKKEQYIRFTYNGGNIIDVEYKDYLKNIGYWSGVPAIQETIYK
jgi:hypothetical protein